MNDKPCPFCGETAHILEDNGNPKTVLCVNPNCELYGDFPMPVKAWNTRPIEDALLEKLEKQGACIEQEILDFYSIRNQLNAQITEVCDALGKLLNACEYRFGATEEFKRANETLNKVRP